LLISLLAVDQTAGEAEASVRVGGVLDRRQSETAAREFETMSGVTTGLERIVQ
jgi:hypothetical protein